MSGERPWANRCRAGVGLRGGAGVISVGAAIMER
jgi:hypothetical protein